MAPRVRELRWPADREAVLSFQFEVYEANFPGFRVTQSFLREYAQQIREATRSWYEKLYVLEDEGKVQGFIWIEVRGTMIDPAMGYVKNVYVAPELRGQGYGQMLLRVADEWFKSQGCTKAALDVSVCNERAIQCYKEAGYEITRYRMEKRYQPEQCSKE